MDYSPLVRPRHISISVRPIQIFFHVCRRCLFSACTSRIQLVDVRPIKFYFHVCRQFWNLTGAFGDGFKATLNSRRHCFRIYVRRRGSSPVGYVASYRFVRRVQYAIAFGLLDKGVVVGGVLGCPNLPLASIASGVSTDSSKLISCLFSQWKLRRRSVGWEARSCVDVRAVVMLERSRLWWVSALQNLSLGFLLQLLGVWDWLWLQGCYLLLLLRKKFE